MTTRERRPVIKQVLQTTHSLTKVMGTSNKLAQILRNMLIPAVMRLRQFQRRFVRNLSELGIAYKGSPIVEGAGERYFDASLRGGKGIGSRFLLVIGDNADSSVSEGAKQLAVSLGEIVEVRLARGDGVRLVRPDGYVAYAVSSRDGVAALVSLRSVLQSQTVRRFD